MLRFDTHIHTNHSPCSGMSPKELVERAEGQLDAIVVCDHNEIQGALEARRIAEVMREMIVELGIECTTEHGEIGAKFLSETEAGFLMTLKRADGTFGFGDLKKALNNIRTNLDSRMLVDLHHPYDLVNPNRGFDFDGAIKAGHFPDEERLMDFFDFTEMNMASMRSKEIWLAIQLARKYRKPIVCATDSHFLGQVGRYFTETSYPTARDGILLDSSLVLPSPEGVNHWLSRWYRLRSKIRKTLK